MYLAKMANKGGVSEKAYRRALQMLSILKENPKSHGKDPNALAVAVLYAACLDEVKRLAKRKSLWQPSIVTLRKRFQDVTRIFP